MWESILVSSILNMMDDNYKYLRYTNKQRMHDTKRKKYLKLLENYRKKSGTLEIEKKLCDYNLKTVNFNNFKKYIDGRNSMNTELLKKYEKKIFGSRFLILFTYCCKTHLV
jgi:hypothetical protein